MVYALAPTTTDPFDEECADNMQKSHCHPKKNLRRGSAMCVLVVDNLEVIRFDFTWS